MSVEGGSGGQVWIVGVVDKCGGWEWWTGVDSGSGGQVWRVLGVGGKEWWMSVEGARRQVWSQAVTAAV